MHRFFVPYHPERDKPIKLSDDAVKKIKEMIRENKLE